MYQFIDSVYPYLVGSAATFLFLGVWAIYRIGSQPLPPPPRPRPMCGPVFIGSRVVEEIGPYGVTLASVSVDTGDDQ